METNAFEDPNSSFYTDLQIKNLFTKQVVTEFTQNKGVVSHLVAECKDILNKLKISESPPSSPLKKSKNSSAPVESPVKVIPVVVIDKKKLE